MIQVQDFHRWTVINTFEIQSKGHIVLLKEDEPIFSKTVTERNLFSLTAGILDLYSPLSPLMKNGVWGRMSKKKPWKLVPGRTNSRSSWKLFLGKDSPTSAKQVVSCPPAIYCVPMPEPTVCSTRLEWLIFFGPGLERNYKDT